MPQWFAGILLGVAGAVIAMLYKSVTDRIKTLEDHKSDSDKRHNAAEVDLAESRADRAAFKETVSELKNVVDKLSDAVSALKVAVGK